MAFLPKAKIAAHLTPLDLDNSVHLFIVHHETCDEGSEVV
jgi:hypothetical protein